jgi:hypothetical protein
VILFSCGKPLTAALSVFAQLVFQIAISLSHGGADFIIEIRREFLHAMNGPAVFQGLFEELCFCLRASRERALRSQLPAVHHFVHMKTPFLIIKIMMILNESRVIP